MKTAFHRAWQNIGTRFLPFADAATEELPLGRMLRLSLFQISVGMAMVLLTGTLNRVMIVELHVSAWLVGLMVALPIIFAPFRALIGYKSDTHKSFLGWRRVPYIWFGTLLQFGGFAIMPFALLVLTGGGHGSALWGQVGAALSFLLVGAGLHTTQTAGLALANDLAPQHVRPRVVALLYVMLLVGMVVSAMFFGWLLQDFTPVQLIQIIQGAAVFTFVLNGIALWKQEARNPALTHPSIPRKSFKAAWADYVGMAQSKRLLAAVGFGSMAFSMQDILLEPFGGRMFALSVGQTTELSAMLAFGTLIGFGLAAGILSRGHDPHRLAALGVLAGIFAFAFVIFSVPLDMVHLFRVGTFGIGFGGGLFSVGMLTSAMIRAETSGNGLALGAWGAMQATAAGLGVALSGFISDFVSSLAASGALGEAMQAPAAGYSFVYHLEILLLFATLVALGPLVGRTRLPTPSTPRFGLAHLPG